MAVIQRWDRSELAKVAPVKTDAGFLRTDAYLTRVGVFTYVTADGRITKELRPADEVFKADSLETLKLVPLTQLHPTESVVDSTNAKRYQSGSVGENVEQAGDFVRSSVMMTDAGLVAAVERGDMRELSAGYTCELDPTPGVFNGERYDAIQRSIKYNHVAVVPRGRAGRDVRLRLDAECAVMVTDAHEHEETTTVKIKIKSKEYDVDDAVAKAYQDAEQAAQAAAADAKAKDAKIDQLQGRADQLDLELRREKDARKDAQDPAKFTEAVKSRLALERTASAFMGDADLSKFDSEVAIKRAVVEKMSPELKLDSVSEQYVEGAYALIVKQSADKISAVQKKKDQLGEVAKTQPDTTSNTRWDAMVEANQNAWKGDAKN